MNHKQKQTNNATIAEMQLILKFMNSARRFSAVLCPEVSPSMASRAGMPGRGVDRQIAEDQWRRVRMTDLDCNS